jgi:hypothetical protein
MVIACLKKVAIVDRRLRWPGLVELRVVVEVVVKAKNSARFTINHQGGIRSHLPVWEIGNEINFRPDIAII